MTSNCDRAKQLAQMAGEDEAEAIIDACCGASEARDCVQALSALAADIGCRAYTNNACEPCCKFVAGVVAKVFVDILYETGLGSVIEDFWELGSAIVNSVFGGDCDFDPAKNAAEAKAIETVEAQAEALRIAWVEVHQKLGIAIPSWSNNGRRVRITIYQGNVWEFAPYPTGKLALYKESETATWAELLLNRAQNLHIDIHEPWGKRFRDFLPIADSSWGSMYFEEVPQSNRSVAIYLNVRFKHWKCDRADQFGEALARALTLRLGAIGQAREYLTKRVGQFYAERYKPPLFQMRFKPVKKSSPGKALATAAATTTACGILGLTWHLLRR